jgi:hypothetical protein
MEYCTAKFKVRNPAEALFVNDMVERVIEVSKQYNLPINHVRFGRQVKSWGSTGVGRYHVYTYGQYSKTPNRIEFWVNGHNADLSEAGRKYLEWCAVRGCLNHRDIDLSSINVSREDMLAFALKYKYKPNKKLLDYLKLSKAADEIVGSNFAFVDEEREEELKQKDMERKLNSIVEALEDE